MGIQIFLLLLSLFGMCFCIYNWWFQSEKYKRYSNEEKKKLNPFNSPAAWGIYTTVFILHILITSGYYIYKLVSGIMEMS